MGKAEYYIKNLVTDACVCSAYTGEILHEFKGLDLLLGKQVWTAWCVGQYYRIVEVTECQRDNGIHVVYWVK